MAAAVGLQRVDRHSLVALAGKLLGTQLTTSCEIGHLAVVRQRFPAPRDLDSLDPVLVISLVVVDPDVQEVATSDRGVLAQVELDRRSLEPAIDRIVRVAAVEESNDLIAPVAVTVAGDREDRETMIDLGVREMEIAPEDREAVIDRVGQVMAIALAVREAAAIDLVDQVMEIALDVRAMAIVLDDLAMATTDRDGQTVLDVPVIDPIGPTDRIGRIADRIGTNGKIGGTIVGQA